VNLSLPLFDPPIEPPAKSSAELSAELSAAGAAPLADAAPLPPQAAGGALLGLSGLVNAAAADPGRFAALGQPWESIQRADQLAALHPGLWRASQMGGAAQRVTASGFEALDAQLPGGGWPHGLLTELLLPQAGVGELRLLAPALAAVAALDDGPAAGGRFSGAGAQRSGSPLGLTSAGQRVPPGASPPKPSDDGRCVMLFDPPAMLSAWALLQWGLDSRHWLVVQARAGQGRVAAAPGQGAPRSANRLAPLLPSADLLWALEQSLKSGHVGAILAWLPLRLRADALRRLQIAAQAHDGPVFIFRDALARSQPSPASLRLLLQPAGVDGLSVRLLKRRGPPLAQPLRLALPSALTPRQQAQAQADEITRQAAQGSGRPVAQAALAALNQR
jgi:protein ImuA